jgi:glycosyltransferase involved in cell wall biosynthesis
VCNQAVSLQNLNDLFSRNLGLPLNVLHLIHRYPPARGGAESYCQRLTEFLKADGHCVEVWTSSANELPAMWNAGYTPLPSTDSVKRFAPVHFLGRRYICKALSLIPYAPWQAYWLPCNPICPEMWRAANTHSAPLDAVHAFAFPYSFLSLCAWKLARRRKVPFFLTPFLHLGDPTNLHDKTRKQYTSRPLRWLLNQADRVFVQTNLEREAIQQLGVPEKRIVLQGLGVDPTECTGGDRAATRCQWAVTEDESVVGHLANASTEKGTIDLLLAVNGLVKVVLAGPEMPSFRAFWKTCPHQNRVIRLGELTEIQKRDFFAGIDLFALPSRSDSFGLVLLEAWANGVPNIVYRAGGPGELVQDRIDGRVVPCGDVQGLAEAIKELATQPELRRQLGEAGRTRLSGFHWPDKLQLVLQELIQAVASK